MFFLWMIFEVTIDPRHATEYSLIARRSQMRPQCEKADKFKTIVNNKWNIFLIMKCIDCKIVFKVYNLER